MSRLLLGLGGHAVLDALGLPVFHGDHGLIPVRGGQAVIAHRTDRSAARLRPFIPTR